jgi:hypothetical protein
MGREELLTRIIESVLLDFPGFKVIVYAVPKADDVVKRKYTKHQVAEAVVSKSKGKWKVICKRCGKGYSPRYGCKNCGKTALEIRDGHSLCNCGRLKKHKGRCAKNPLYKINPASLKKGEEYVDMDVEE